MSKQTGYEKITDRIVAMLEGGTIPWRKPRNANGGPTSLSTGKAYRGINVMILGITGMIEGYSSPFWGTYKQISENGGQIQKGAKSTPVTLWKPLEKMDENGNPKKAFFMTTFNVFNADQAEWEEGKKPSIPDMVEHDALENAEQIIAQYLANGPSLGFGGDRACYSPSRDHVQMPEMGSFKSVEGYYSTMFHELTHSTGHASRLAREGVTEGHSFGDALYSKEELVAEMGAAFLCMVAGIDPDTTLANSAAYVKNWLSVLKNDPKMIVQAAGKAQRAADLIQGVEVPKREEKAA